VQLVDPPPRIMIEPSLEKSFGSGRPIPAGPTLKSEKDFYRTTTAIAAEGTGWAAGVASAQNTRRSDRRIPRIGTNRDVASHATTRLEAILYLAIYSPEPLYGGGSPSALAIAGSAGSRSASAASGRH
jgi:hypothetical protein